jgi:hypothetical protein
MSLRERTGPRLVADDYSASSDDVLPAFLSAMLARESRPSSANGCQLMRPR